MDEEIRHFVAAGAGQVFQHRGNAGVGVCTCRLVIDLADAIVSQCFRAAPDRCAGVYGIGDVVPGENAGVFAGDGAFPVSGVEHAVAVVVKIGGDRDTALIQEICQLIAFGRHGFAGTDVCVGGIHEADSGQDKPVKSVDIKNGIFTVDDDGAAACRGAPVSEAVVASFQLGGGAVPCKGKIVGNIGSAA